VASAIRAFFVFKLVTHSGFEDPIVGVTWRSHIKISDLPQKKFTKHQKPRPILSALITSKTRLKLLLKLFSHPEAQGYLRGFAQEFDESTNSVRIGLGKMHEAGLIVAQQEGQRVLYRSNIQNPFYRELSGLVSKQMGFDQLLERVQDQVGELFAANVVGDYAKGLDSGTIEVAIVGEVDSEYLERLTIRA
jgi:hypothetical protein